MELSIKEIAAFLGGEISGDGNGKVHMLSKIQEAKHGEIAFLSNPKYENYIYDTQASAVIVKVGFEPRHEVKPTLIFVEDPYLSFTLLLEEYHKFVSFQKTGIEKPSFQGEGVTVGNNIYRGAFSYIGNNVTIGNNVKVYPHCYVGDHVSIGDNTILHAGVRLYAGITVGANCVMHSGVVVGSDGFGFAPQEDGSYKTIPQLGSVVIEDHVHIGANTVVDCATFHGDSTIIRKGVKLDNLIQIAHNVEIGKNTVIAAQSGVSGSTKIGENCVLAGQVGVVGHLEIGDNTTIAAQSGVTKSFKEGNTIILGSPSFDRKEYLRSYAVFRNLPDISSRLKQLEKVMANLPVPASPNSH